MLEDPNSTEFEANVRTLSAKGMGVVTHPDGRIFFVRGGWPGETGIFRITNQAKSYEEVQSVRWLTTSETRVPVPCPHQGTAPGECSGCPWMGISYPEQVKAKEQKIQFLLSKNQLHPKKVHPIVAAPAAFGYRNRAQFKTDGARIGYVSEGTNVLAPIQDCLILNDKMRELLAGLRSSLPKPEWQPNDGFPWSYLDVDDSQALAEVVPNKRRPFRQGNTVQNDAMKSWIVKSLASVPTDWPVIEAFCGSGNLTEALSQVGFSKILAAEVRGVAIEELRAKALPGVQVMEIDMNERGVWQQLAKRSPDAKILLIDPPREGVEKRRGIFDHLKALKMVIYISCEPSTWARDVKDFVQNGWKLEHVTPLDLFPHTHHVEVLSVLTHD